MAGDWQAHYPADKAFQVLVQLYSYLWSLGDHWIGAYWYIALVPEIGNLIVPLTSKNLAKQLDRFVSRETRHRVLVAIALVGVFAAGFQAWSQEYQAVQTISNQKQKQERTQSAKIGESTGTIKQLTQAVNDDRAMIARLQTDLAEKAAKATGSPIKSLPPNKYVCISNIAPLPPSKAKYAVLVELGIHRVDSNGVIVAISTEHPYTNHRHWFGPPLRTDLPIGEMDISAFGETITPPLYVLKISTPSLTVYKSLYLYLEGDQPLVVKNIEFVENYAALSEQTLLAKLLAEPIGACPR
ncbi:MAG: hypothetical protein ACREQR_01125 [Candidatus Binataceae bacterium]